MMLPTPATSPLEFNTEALAAADAPMPVELSELAIRPRRSEQLTMEI